MLRNIVSQFTRERIASSLFFFGVYMAVYSKVVGLAFIFLSPFLLMRSRKNLINDDTHYKNNDN